MSAHLSADTRRRAVRWGLVLLAAFVLFAPVGMIGSCADGAAGGECTIQPTSLVGLLLGIGYPGL